MEPFSYEKAGRISFCIGLQPQPGRTRSFQGGRIYLPCCNQPAAYYRSRLSHRQRKQHPLKRRALCRDSEKHIVAKQSPVTVLLCNLKLKTAHSCQLRQKRAIHDLGLARDYRRACILTVRFSFTLCLEIFPLQYCVYLVKTTEIFKITEFSCRASVSLW